jgi:tyrosyl-DNA phosphodiesterase-1
MSESRETKRRKVGGGLMSLERNISPPPSSRHIISTNKEPLELNSAKTGQDAEIKQFTTPCTSPFRLTSISELPGECNINTVSLKDLLCHESLKEAWIFDYLFNLDFVLSHLHPKIAKDVHVKIVHGSYQDSDHSRHINQWNNGSKSEAWPNVSVICAYIGERFGTHHTKMMILFFNDDTAQVIIHTANMIEFDWTNMTQGAWLSPKLPHITSPDSKKVLDSQDMSIGSGNRFKVDLLRYLRVYERRTAELVSQLQLYDFSTIRAAFLASAPTFVRTESSKPDSYTSFGWLGFKEILSSISKRTSSEGDSFVGLTSAKDTIVVQVSSIASLGEKWETHFFDILNTSQGKPKAHVKILFPHVQDVQDSLEGYRSGSSIHMKTTSSTGKPQIIRLRPKFCQWSPGLQDHERINNVEWRDGLRGPAAPHIKTFMRFSDNFKKVEWALLTSANLSKQAWGEMPNKEGKVRICSYEVGVMVFPQLFSEKQRIAFVPTFGKDTLEVTAEGDETIQIPLRMPYGLPPIPYQAKHVAWSTDAEHKGPDRHGRKWDI